MTDCTVYGGIAYLINAWASINVVAVRWAAPRGTTGMDGYCGRIERLDLTSGPVPRSSRPSTLCGTVKTCNLSEAE